MFGLGPRPHVNGFLARAIGLALLAVLIAGPNVLRPSAGAVDERLSMVTTALASPEGGSESHHVNSRAGGCDDASAEVSGQDCHGGGASALLAPEAQCSNVLPRPQVVGAPPAIDTLIRLALVHLRPPQAIGRMHA